MLKSSPGLVRESSRAMMEAKSEDISMSKMAGLTRGLSNLYVTDTRMKVTPS